MPNWSKTSPPTCVVPAVSVVVVVRPPPPTILPPPSLLVLVLCSVVVVDPNMKIPSGVVLLVLGALVGPLVVGPPVRIGGIDGTIVGT